MVVYNLADYVCDNILKPPKKAIMDTEGFCQSCSMPLNTSILKGTEKNGALSDKYCKFCYQNGAFTDPNLTIEKMKERITRMMFFENVPADKLEAAFSRLPHLQRWKH